MRHSIFARAVLLLAGISLATQDDADSEAQVMSAIEVARRNYDARALAYTINGGGQTTSGRFINKSTPKTEQMGQTFKIYLEALQILINEYEMDRSKAEISLYMPRQTDCAQPSVVCNPSQRYRSVNGTCNNLKNPLWGSAYYRQSREVPSEYFGTDYQPRGGQDPATSTLPDPREVSLAVHTGDNYTDPIVTHLVAQFGQFLDHDLSLTPEGGKICCADGAPVTDPEEDCWPILPKDSDPFYGPKNVTCLDYTRSTPVCYEAGREQMNIITAFIDASAVYGSDASLALSLRSFTNGELLENSEVKGFIPWTSDVYPDVNTPGVIIAGDRRANEMPGLTVLHTLFYREHNRIARELSSKTSWDDEQIYQETRRIVGAQMQKISISEYLPVILGPEVINNYNLELGTTGQTTIYDETIDPTIFNSFSTAAYRFGHTLVNGLIFMMMEDQVQEEYYVRDNYFKPDRIIGLHRNSTEGYEQILNGLIRQRSQRSDAIISEDMTNYLFQTVSNTFGSDLAARNIKRGRDHGLPGYHAFRPHCNLSLLTDWETRPVEMSEAAWDKLRDAYPLVTDIDLYTGALSETTVVGGQTGPVFACLMGIQFHRLLYGDRFFFTHSDQAGSFTSTQIAEIKSRTFGDLICDNSDLKETPSNVFLLQVDATNPMVACDATGRHKFNLDLFIGEVPVTSEGTTVPSTPSTGETETGTSPTSSTTGGGNTGAACSITQSNTSIILSLSVITTLSAIKHYYS